ncbi:response regulator [Shimia thalassica]|uniref:response regulator n=1 Tax=Shimia thalassica TaxID=1715693 RepID=UPI0024948381|nr:response regulator [Shimia thalassica]
MSNLQKILHVEDDPDIREIVKICLETLGGFTLLQCESGKVALDAAPSFGADLYMLDMMMPGMNGLETLEALRAQESQADTPAIFVTSVDTAERYRASIEELAIGAIQKPFDPTSLPQQVNDLWATTQN